jgi:hypothetical protein
MLDQRPIAAAVGLVGRQDLDVVRSPESSSLGVQLEIPGGQRHVAANWLNAGRGNWKLDEDDFSHDNNVSLKSPGKQESEAATILNCWHV